MSTVLLSDYLSGEEKNRELDSSERLRWGFLIEVKPVKRDRREQKRQVPW